MAKKPKTTAINAALAKRQQRANALFDATVKNAPDFVRGAGPGALDALGRAYNVSRDYIQSRTPQQVAGDVAKGLGAAGDATARYATDRAQNPLKLLGDAYGVTKDIVTSIPQAASAVGHLSERAQALKATDPAAARRMQAGIAMAAMGVMPGVRTGKKVAKAVGEAEELAAKYAVSAPAPERMDVWHGSNAVFDKFDPAFMNKGEGSQGRGYGFYFNDRAPGTGTNPRYGGTTVAEDYAKKISSLRGGKGQLYRSSIPAKGYLEYGKPLSEQPAEIQDAFSTMLGKRWAENNPDADANKLLSAVEDSAFANMPLARKKEVLSAVAPEAPDYARRSALSAAYLRQHGVVGTKHSDAPSQILGGSSYAVFDPTDIQVVERRAFGKEGAVAQDLGAKYGLPEFTTDLTPAQIEANRAAHMAGAKSPPVLYHGTTSGNIEAFRDRSRGPKLMDGLGAHFGTVDAAQDRLVQNVGKDAEGANILPVHANIQNPPLKKDGSYMTEGELQSFLSRIASGIGIPKSEHRGMAVYGGVKPPVYAKLKDELKARGYDGLAYVNSHEGRGSTSWVAFDPARQVKSTMNRGTFDPNEPHLNKARGGLIKKYGV